MNCTRLSKRFSACNRPRLDAHWDLFGLALLLVAANLHLLGLPGGPRLWAYAPGAMAAGRTWSILMHPFAHINPYHLLLDAGSFFMLYPLVASHPLRRLAAFVALLFVSTGLACLDPDIHSFGFAGLSGVGHGLMALVAGRMIAAPCAPAASRRAGWILLSGVTLKAIVEAAGGEVFLSCLHLAPIGNPNTLSHLGGILGALLLYGVGSHLQGVIPQSSSSSGSRRSGISIHPEAAAGQHAVKT